jgi:uncharacterized protein
MPQLTSAQMTESVKQMLDHISASRFAELGSFFTEDAALEWPYAREGEPKVISGRKALVETIGYAPMVMTKVRMEIRGLYPSPEAGALIAEVFTTADLNRGGRYENLYAMIFVFRDGKISVWREYFNPNNRPNV